MSDTYEKLLGAAFHFLSFRERSEKEMREFLTKRVEKIDASLTLVDRVLDRLCELQFVDDYKFASWWIEQRSGRKPKGTALIARELAQKGVAKDIIAEALSAQTTPESQFEAAKRAISPKLHSWERLLPSLVQKKKIYDYLGRRGFASNIISRVIDWATKKDYNTST